MLLLTSKSIAIAKLYNTSTILRTKEMPYYSAENSLVHIGLVENVDGLGNGQRLKFHSWSTFLLRTGNGNFFLC